MIVQDTQQTHRTAAQRETRTTAQRAETAVLQCYTSLIVHASSCVGMCQEASVVWSGCSSTGACGAPGGRQAGEAGCTHIGISIARGLAAATVLGVALAPSGKCQLQLQLLLLPKSCSGRARLEMLAYCWNMR
jgi:hypothetical protein